MNIMQSVLTTAFITGLLSATVRMAVPILLSALGETFSERAGVLNIGLEGIILIGAFTGFVGAYYTQNVLIGILCGIGIGFLMGLMIAYLSVTLGINQMVSGIAVNMLGAGITSFLYRMVFGVVTIPPRTPPLPVLPIPFLKDIPVLGEVFFRHNILVYITYLLIPLSMIVLYKTSFGLKVRSVGEHPRAADTVGVSVTKIRYSALCICGVLSGLAGTFLSLGQLNMFMDNMSSGRGFIALAAVIFGKWDPLGVVGASVIFALADALQLRLQSLGFAIPYQFLVMLPYVLTVLALIGARKGKGPAALGVAYSNEN